MYVFSPAVCDVPADGVSVHRMAAVRPQRRVDRSIVTQTDSGGNPSEHLGRTYRRGPSTLIQLRYRTAAKYRRVSTCDPTVLFKILGDRCRLLELDRETWRRASSDAKVAALLSAVRATWGPPPPWPEQADVTISCLPSASPTCGCGWERRCTDKAVCGAETG